MYRPISADSPPSRRRSGRRRARNPANRRLRAGTRGWVQKIAPPYRGWGKGSVQGHVSHVVILQFQLAVLPDLANHLHQLPLSCTIGGHDRQHAATEDCRPKRRTNTVDKEVCPHESDVFSFLSITRAPQFLRCKCRSSAVNDEINGL